MLRFKTFISLFEQLILEDRISFLKTQYKDKLPTTHDALAQHQSSDDIIDHFSNNADPTKNKIHTQWILNRYREGSIRQEDHSRIRTALSNFEAHKSKLPNKDIGQYKSLSDIETAVEPHLGQATSKRQETKAIKSEGADLLHSENGVTVHEIKTHKAACEYGKGTKWCTASRDDPNTFESYHKHGPLYVIHARDHKGTGQIKKYQFHPATNQLMDEKDKTVKSNELLKHNPEVLKSPIGPHFNEYYDSPEKVDHILKTNNPDFIKKALSSSHVNSDHISKALEHPNEQVRSKVKSLLSFFNYIKKRNSRGF